MKTTDKDRFELWKEVRNIIDQLIVKKEKKTFDHHRAIYSGNYEPSEFVVCEDGQMLPYSPQEEKVLNKALRYRFEGIGDSEEILNEAKQLKR